MQSFRGVLKPVPHGGHYVPVPEKVAERAGLAHAKRVRGSVNGVPYRSSLMKYSGVFHLGIHKATLTKAGIDPAAEASVKVTIELDDEPLPTDVVPDDLAAALAKNARARNAFATLRPSLKREYVKAILAAKRAETRERRVKKTLDELLKSS
jgi:Bacteriocin-protection, YdeI or OmpD-Associated/Domain of unknown function (DUF1905)